MVRRPTSTMPQSVPYPVIPSTNSEPSSVHRDVGAQEPDLQYRHRMPGGAESMQNTNTWRETSMSTHREPRSDLSQSSERVERASYGQIQNIPAIPASLRAGHADITPRSSVESQRSETLPFDSGNSSALSNNQSNNPYLHSKNIDAASPQNFQLSEESSAKAWANTFPTMPIHTSSPKRQVLTSPLETANMTVPVVAQETSPFAEPWMDFKISPEQTPVAPNSTSVFGEHAIQSDRGHSDYHEAIKGPLSPKSSSQQSYMTELQELEAEATVWSPPKDEGGTILTHLPPSQAASQSDEIPPELPPRRLVEEDAVSPPKPPRPQIVERMLSGQPASSGSEMERQQARVKQQRSETYQIRLVNWFDASSPRNPRRSPIMVQNRNGPCPLLALVNALVLSTPANLTTALVETLRVREQVSLGLLLDAVIDELMSGRRGDAAQALPDVSELYAFLINLHTGMNVNPVFVEPVRQVTSLIDEPIPGQATFSQEARRPGGFEETSAMRLYSTFAVALIHGWLPRRNHPVCAALERSAKTYEDAQSLMFAEEELESKIRDQGLNDDEQRLLEDIASVKYFLASSPTQLTEYGLDRITETLVPGSVAILFRNDHFSTLYKQPRSGRIFTLVTDMGYAGHDEVVWESLVDVSGEGSEFFSGDFLPVGNNVGSNRRQSSHGDDSGWTTVSRSSGNARRANPSSSKMPPDPSNNSEVTTTAISQLSLNEPDGAVRSSNIEQEDHDLALAMQLQEEEEDRERQEVASRRREDELSRAYLDSQGPSNRKDHRAGFDVRPQVPPRGGGSRQTQQRKQTDSDEAPPPSYEQAAKGPAYIPPLSTVYQEALPSATNVSASRSPAVQPGRQSSAYSQTSASYAALAGSPISPSSSSRQGRRRNSFTRSPVTSRGVHPAAMQGVPSAAFRRQHAEDDDRKDCILM